MYIGVSWSGENATDIIGKGYGDVHLFKSSRKLNNEFNVYEYENIRAEGIHKCKEGIFPYQTDLAGGSIYCFKNPELLKIIRHNNDTELQTWFQINFYRRSRYFYI